MPSHSLPRIPTIGQREKVPRSVYTISECQSCHAKVKRPFSIGDYVNKEDGPCQTCKGTRIITTIYSEEAPQSK